ncbi:MAG: hypothetical protein ISN28_14825 [Ectothiorhodospiraceae bacterium AqS1]|nr:hypothetical protein [Ectothiorhodospiraceae bacterium AqS1]
MKKAAIIIALLVSSIGSSLAAEEVGWFRKSMLFTDLESTGVACSGSRAAYLLTPDRQARLIGRKEYELHCGDQGSIYILAFPVPADGTMFMPKRIR